MSKDKIDRQISALTMKTLVDPANRGALIVTDDTPISGAKLDDTTSPFNLNLLNFPKNDYVSESVASSRWIDPKLKKTQIIVGDLNSFSKYKYTP
jgi:hypothetical protein